MKFGIGMGIAVLMVVGCSEKGEHTVKSRTPVVYTVNYPLAYFTERIAGDAVTVVFPDMDGDPAFWEPAAEDILAYQDADLILLNGAEYAKWVPKASLPQRRLVDTSAGIQDRFIAMDGSITHTHGPGGEHAHGDLAFTTWLDPELAMMQAEAIYAVLQNKWGVDRDGLETLQTDIAELDQSLKSAFSLLGDQPILGSHPVYQYLARRYGLNMKSVHWEPGVEPDAAMWRELEDILKVHDAKVMMWEDEPLPGTAAALQERGITSTVFNPCGNRPEQGNYLDVMYQNLDGWSD